MNIARGVTACCILVVTYLTTGMLLAKCPIANPNSQESDTDLLVECVSKLTTSSINPDRWLRLIQKVDVSEPTRKRAWSQILKSDNETVVKQALVLLQNNRAVDEQNAKDIVTVICNNRISASTRILASRLVTHHASTAQTQKQLRDTLLSLTRESKNPGLLAEILNLLNAKTLLQLRDEKDTLAALARQHPVLESSLFLAMTRQPLFVIAALTRTSEANWLLQNVAKTEIDSRRIAELFHDAALPDWLRLVCCRILLQKYPDQGAMIVPVLGSAKEFLADAVSAQLLRFGEPNKELADAMSLLIRDGNDRVQLRAGQTARSLKLSSAKFESAIKTRLQNADGATNDKLIATFLDCLANLSTSPSTRDFVGGFLPDNATIYQGRDKQQVVRLRGYVLATLARMGVPRQHYRSLIDSLVNVDDQMLSFEVGAAVFAVSSLGAEAKPLAPFLLDAYRLSFFDDDFSLENYDPEFLPVQGTTLRLEIVKSLGQICDASDHRVTQTLKSIASSKDSELRFEARCSLRKINSKTKP